MHIALIGCGEVGGTYARALNAKVSLSLCDIEPGGRPGKVARELGLPLHAAPDEWLGACDIAIAAVPGQESGGAAASALPFLSPGSLYIDVSTGAPDSLRKSAKNFETGARAFVDAAIMGAISLHGGATPVLVAGAETARAAAVFQLMDAPVTMLDDARPGDAVALKLLRSVIIKGLECLAIESLTAAEHMGVRPRLLELLGDLDRSPIADYLGALVTTHLVHAERRMHEMNEAATQLRAAGFDAAVTGALEKRYQGTLAGRQADPPEKHAHDSVDAAIAWLTQVGLQKPA
ncbi:MAG: DUF1932 domain-containing protein [Hyphomicrobiales bacterium]|nr:DUF1932 domain-containing protein [Hyphomicrobiales bacterium]